MAIRTGARSRLGVQVSDCASGRASAASTGAAWPERRLACRPAAIASSSNASGEIDPGSLGQTNQGRRREADSFGGLGERRSGSVQRDLVRRVEHQAAVHPAEHHRVVLDAQDRAARSGELLEQLRDRPGPGRVELGGRLVEDQHGRAHRHDARDGDPLLLAAGQRERLAVREVADRQALEGRVDPRVHLVARDAEVLEPERELLADRQLRRRQLVGRRREDDPDPAEQCAGGGRTRRRRPRSRPRRRASPGRPGG